MSMETGMSVGEKSEFYLHLNILLPRNSLKQNTGKVKLPCHSSLNKKKKKKKKDKMLVT